MCYVHVAALVAEYLTRKGTILKSYLNVDWFFFIMFRNSNSFPEEAVGKKF